MSVALQLGTSAAGGGWSADQRLCRGVSQARRTPAPTPGRRYSLVTLINVIHSDRAVFAAPAEPPPPDQPADRAAGAVRASGTGGREPCLPASPNAAAKTNLADRSPSSPSALSRRPSLASPPSDGREGDQPASELASCADVTRGESEAGDAPSHTLHENISQQTKRQLRGGRCSLEPAARRRLWTAICRHHGAEPDAAEEYRDTVRQMEGQYGPAQGPQLPRTPLKLSSYSHTFGLEPAALWTAERLLAVLAYNNPAVTYSPPLFSICCLLLTYLDEEDVYCCLCMMLKNSKLGYMVQTKRQCEISWRTLVKLCRRHARGSMRFLQRLAGGSEAVRHLLADWMAWIFTHLPFSHVVRIFDCYLMEGEKVLYRAAIALIVLLHKQTARQPGGDGAGRWSSLLAEQPVQSVMRSFCQQIPVTPRKLLKTMFTIRAFSRGTLNSSYAKAREQIRAAGGRITFPELSSVDEAGSEPPQQSLPSLASQRTLEGCSRTIGIKELLRLWESVPARFSLCSPLLLYTSSEHGFSLKTFYQRVGAFEPTVLLLRTAEDAVIGAYCSKHWDTRNELLEDGSRQAYFGTGETFVFTLRPELRLHRWVGSARDPGSAALRHDQQLFQAADSGMITVGGGGGQAVWLDESLSRGRTERCHTFDNPPLAATAGFEVTCIEVFGFAPS